MAWKNVVSLLMLSMLAERNIGSMDEIPTLTPLVTTRWTTMPFLSSPLTFMLVYIWSRRNPYVRMSFLGIFNFTAPYLPWVLLTFTMLLNGVWPTGDLLGMGVGHVYYFLDDVWPRTGNGDRPRLLRAPDFVRRLFEPTDRGQVLSEGLRDLYEQQGDQALGQPEVPAVGGGASAAPAANAGQGEGSSSEAWTLVEGDDDKTSAMSSPASMRSQPVATGGLRDRSATAAAFAGDAGPSSTS
ncbi:hypothetical protein HDU67_008132 [Dinochytrium kinnereticum]|nr:hypothetical protein HDU67_008132 [Dinochytrium kinnereticum]